MATEEVKTVEELLADTVPMVDPAEAENGRIAREQLSELGLKTVGEAGWLDPDNEAPPLRALLTVHDSMLDREVPFMPAGKVAMLVAPGGTGKSQALVQLAVAVAGGKPWLDTYDVPEPGSVLLALGEEDAVEMHRRIRQAVGAVGWDVAEAVNRNLHVLSLCGESVAFLDEDGYEAEFYKTLQAGLTAFPDVDWRLIILDPASRFLGPNAESDNAQATRFIETVERLTRLQGNPTVLFAHHTNKTALAGSTDQGAARGSSALTDGARWQANLDRVTEEEFYATGQPTKKRIAVQNQAILRVVKANHCAVQPELRLLRDPNRRGYLRPDKSPPPVRAEPVVQKGSAAGRRSHQEILTGKYLDQQAAVSNAEKLADQAKVLATAETDPECRAELEGKAKAAAELLKTEKGKLRALEAKLELANMGKVPSATIAAGRDRAAGAASERNDF